MTRRKWAPDPQIHYGTVPLPPQPVYPTLIINYGATSYWRLGESSGPLVDSAGTSDLTVNGAPTLHNIPGGLVTDDDGAVIFPTVNDFLTTPDNAPLDLGDGPWSMAFLLRRDVDTGATQTLWTKGTNAYSVTIRGSTDLLTLNKEGVNNLVSATGVIPVSAVNWLHFVITRTGAGAGNTLIYKNGVEGHVDLNPAVALADSASQLEFGRVGATTRLAGGLDEVAFFKGIILTPLQIADLVAAI